MEQKPVPVSDFNSLNMLFNIYKWRKQLIILAVAACAISSIISLGITEKYKSTVILFPGVTYSASKALIADNQYRPDVNEFGDEEKAEQMLQILNSNEVRDKICKKYNLMKHYDIDSTSKLARTSLNDEFQGNVSFSRTKFMSVQIDVMDNNPKYAAMIANDIAALHDSARYNIQKQRTSVAHQIIEQEYLTKANLVKQLRDSVKMYNGLGILDMEAQSKVTSQQYVKAIAKNDQRAVSALQQKLDILAKHGSAFVSARDNLYFQRIQLNGLRTKLEEAKLDLENILPQKFIVSSAEPAEKKSYPVRWVIVAVSTLSTLLIGIILLFLFENLKHVKVK